MKKLLLIAAFTLSVPTAAQAQQKSNTTIAVDYESPQQLIKNYYAAQEFCQSSTKENDPETTIMCNYRDAADIKLNQLGYCFGDNDEQSMAEREWKKCSQRSKKTTTLNTATTTEATTVSEAVINEAVQDIDNTCYEHGFDGFAQNVLNCFSTRSGPLLQKCMLEDLAFISFYNDLLQAYKTKNGHMPKDAEIPFYSGSDILYRERVYYLPIFKSIENAAIFFKPGLEKAEEALAKCSLKIMDDAKKLQH
ncbi:hypothetical protein [Commensalibacter oyaizuii]|uniref:Lysozyme inhibitor LprI N-terminal domain-containing protein n=1 Tax=Commensalibacter oyaizuii TaxID=3043873 RepID=A0ABT6Q397_9PROT|nr:hypothetical protein [Commensalibacter sp. TBRC 16381]MDI2091594.1 hypothetical protein [Commensalibacter sp. TBRC 16381]